MQKSVMIKIPNNKRYFNLINFALRDLASESGFKKELCDELVEATRELVENAIVHAYKWEEGLIEVDISPFENGIRVDVRDWGEPISHEKPRSVPIDKKEDKGFNRIYKLVDGFDYRNLGKDGKKFTLIKILPHHKEVTSSRLLSGKDEENKFSIDRSNPPKISIRKFEKRDAESIARLIYRNYGYTYLKELFYYPKKIIENEGKKFFSVIAEADGKIVGHFALVRAKDSNIAEVGVVVVDPRFKGLGIMGKMFKALIKMAQELNFAAVYGEAIMFHPFSQKSNLSHGFCETALIMGRVNEDTALTDNELSSKKERGSVLVAYRIFKPLEKQLYLPDIYRDMIEYIYKKCKNISYNLLENKKEREKYSKFAYLNDPLSNTATLVIDHVGEQFEKKFNFLLEYARSKHNEMIYADICLESIACIDDVVEFLNSKHFFFGGVLFLKHHNRDYLRMQYRHTDHLGKRNLVCHSEFCAALYTYIKNDQKRIREKIKI